MTEIIDYITDEQYDKYFSHDKDPVDCYGDEYGYTHYCKVCSDERIGIPQEATASEIIRDYEEKARFDYNTGEYELSRIDGDLLRETIAFFQNLCLICYDRIIAENEREKREEESRKQIEEFYRKKNKCKNKNCEEKKLKGRSYCRNCYYAYMNRQTGICIIENCGKKAVVKSHCLEHSIEDEQIGIEKIYIEWILKHIIPNLLEAKKTGCWFYLTALGMPKAVANLPRDMFKRMNPHLVIEKGQHVRHICHSTGTCVNYQHLLLGSSYENCYDKNFVKEHGEIIMKIRSELISLEEYKRMLETDLKVDDPHPIEEYLIVPNKIRVLDEMVKSKRDRDKIHKNIFK